MTLLYKKGKRIRHTRTSDIYEGSNTDPSSDCSKPGYALKVVDPDFYQAPHDVRREIRLLERLQTPGNAHVCGFLEAEWEFDLFTIVMPLYEMTLDEYLKRHTRQRTRMGPDGILFRSVSLAPVAELDAILLGVARGLAYVHSLGIIHRDVKPLNIMILKETAKICDFSISYEVGGDNGEEVDNNKYTDVGTGIYKAIELCFGVCSYLYEVDIWALAIMMTLMYLDTDGPTIELPGNTGEVEMNDLMVIKTVFESLGTPSIDASVGDSRLYWPLMKDDAYHFKQFQFAPQPRKPIQTLLPRCDSESVRLVFERLAVYESSVRASSSELVLILEATAQ